MKIVIAGDNHGEKDSLKKIVNKEPNTDLFLHTGDSLLLDYELTPFVSVKGNCDYLQDYPESRTIKTPIGKLLITHGHLLYKYNLRYLKENEIKIFVTGHTHIHKAYYVANILFINPGSIDFPRDGIDGTYAVLNISETDIRYKFKTLFDDNVDLL